MRRHSTHLCRHRACPGDPGPRSSPYREDRDQPGRDKNKRCLAPLAREVKLLAAPIAAISGEGVFEGYASLFGRADLGKDIVVPGAFAASLARRGVRGVRMLWQHDAGEPIGRWLSIAEDARGLFVRGKLNLQVERAREIHALMREGAIDGLSIGFRVERARHDRAAGLRRLERLDLWEISVVTFPMLPDARVSGVKRDAIPPPCGEGGLGRRPSRVGVAPPGDPLKDEAQRFVRRARAGLHASSPASRGGSTPTPTPPRKGEGNALLAGAIRRAARRLFISQPKRNTPKRMV